LISDARVASPEGHGTVADDCDEPRGDCPGSGAVDHPVPMLGGEAGDDPAGRVVTPLRRLPDRHSVVARLKACAT